jgi:hypothetical protein
MGAALPRLAIIRPACRTSWLNTPAGQGRDRIWAADRDHINTLARVMPDFKTSLTMILVVKANRMTVFVRIGAICRGPLV